MKRWGNKQAEDAEGKAKEAESNSKVSLSKEEYDKNVMRAKIWREVADKLRIDNEELQKKMQDIMGKAEDKATDDINKIESDAVFEVNEKEILLKKDRSILSLPKPE